MGRKKQIPSKIRLPTGNDESTTRANQKLPTIVKSNDDTSSEPNNNEHESTTKKLKLDRQGRSRSMKTAKDRQERSHFRKKTNEHGVVRPGKKSSSGTVPGYAEDVRNRTLPVQSHKEEVEDKRQRCLFDQAIAFVQTLKISSRAGGCIFEILSQLPLAHQRFEVIDADDMVFLAERMLGMQEEFRKQGVDTRVDIGFHYTRAGCLKFIRSDGLLTNSDREAVGMNIPISGARFGKGIYTANNPYAFSLYGPIGIFVARLKGTCAQWKDLGGHESMVPATIHTVLGNRNKDVPDTDEVVLRNSSQCLPLICYNCIPLGDQDVQSVLPKIAMSLQQLVDQFLTCNFPLNKRSLSHLATTSNFAPEEVKSSSIREPGKHPDAKISTRGKCTGKHDPTSWQGGRFPTAVTSSTVSGVQQHLPNTKMGMATLFGAHVGPATVPMLTETLHYTAPKSLLQHKDEQCYVRVSELSSGECAVCFETFSTAYPPMALRTCRHQFHTNCIQAVLQRSRQCPKCRQHVRKPQGISPSGTMAISWWTTACSGYGPGTFVIDYLIPSGVQFAYHENPGHNFQGVTRRAYVPDGKEGCQLLKRLKYAFMRGLTFSVGTSLTTGRTNIVTWSRIPHKTLRDGTIYGFPDPDYFMSCNEELDNLGVPRAESGERPEAKPSTGGVGTAKLDPSWHGIQSPTALPSTVSGVRQHLHDTKPGTATSFAAYAGPATVSMPVCLTETLVYYAPKTLFHDKDDCYRVCQLSSGECAICLETFSMTDLPVELQICSHKFHANCIEAVLQQSSQCPKCRLHVREPRGISPSGTMTVIWSSTHCSGYGTGTFVVDYDIPSGVQLAYHENPGHSYEGVTRRAYVPDCDEGRRLVKRLKYAFMRGLTFDVGTSLTTGRRNTVTWASIPHKTVMNGTIYGFPDPNYFMNCNVELDNLGVPRDECGGPLGAKPTTRGIGTSKVDPHLWQGDKFPTALPSHASGPRQHLSDTKTGMAGLHRDAHAVAVPMSANLTETLKYTAPKSLFTDRDNTCYYRYCMLSSGECAVCLETFSMTDLPVALLVCCHEFHVKCIQAVLQRSSQCPVCRQQVREPQGISPSGTMVVAWSSTPCSGYGPGTFVIDYCIPSGVQHAYHENPGHSFEGATRRAFVPDCDQGRRLVQRLKYAFMRGLTFSVGTSLTTGRTNRVTWASIHHKTFRDGTIHGFPDPDYIMNCNLELDNLGVPRVSG